MLRTDAVTPMPMIAASASPTVVSLLACMTRVWCNAYAAQSPVECPRLGSTVVALTPKMWPEFVGTRGSAVANRTVMTIRKVLTPVAFVAVLSMAAAPAHADQRRGGGRYRGVERGRVVVRGGGGFIRARPPFYRPLLFVPAALSLGFGLWMEYPVPYPYYGSPYPYAPQYVDPYAYGAPPPTYPSPNYPSNYPSPNYPSNYPSPNYPSNYPPPNYPSNYPPPNYPSNYPPPNYPSSNYPSSNYPPQRPAPPVGVERGDAQSESGISFEITPENAAVFVDGTYVGTAGEFGPAAQPLDLAPGHHRVEVRAPGYRTTTFDADVQPGQVIPFQGTLQRN